MQHLFVKKPLNMACLFIFICLTAFLNPAKAGLDYYKIFIGKKLIYERFLDKPLSLESLPISAADANANLTIQYFQCNAPGKVGSNRSIALKDERGNTIKQWSFADAKNANAGMTIPVKELQQLQKQHKRNALALYYTAEGRTEGMKLASIQTASKSVTYLQEQNNSDPLQIAWQVVSLLFKNLVAG